MHRLRPKIRRQQTSWSYWVPKHALLVLSHVIRAIQRLWCACARPCTAAVVVFTSATAGDLTLHQPAPALVLHALDGRSISTQDLHGQVVIATFWASWCDPCRQELPLLSDYAASHVNDGIQILGFSLDDADSLPEVKEIAATLKFPAGLLGNPWVPEYGRIWRVPVSFIIDRQGMLVYNGWDDANPILTADHLRNIVDPLLSQQ